METWGERRLGLGGTVRGTDAGLLCWRVLDKGGLPPTEAQYGSSNVSGVEMFVSGSHELSSGP